VMLIKKICKMSRTRLANFHQKHRQKTKLVESRHLKIIMKLEMTKLRTTSQR